MGFSLKYDGDGLWYGTFAHFDSLNIKHGISARFGGVSEPPYATLNLALHTGDEADRVNINRQRFCQAVGVNYGKLVTAQQVHGDRVAVIGPDDAGKGSRSYEDALGDTDAMITDVQGVPLMMFFADCVPVLIVDPVRKAVGASHAGWKGTLNRIVQKTILAMQDNYGTNPADCLAGIGPSIGQCCYQVGNEVAEQLKGFFANWKDFVIPEGERWRLNLWAINRYQLEEAGVQSGNVVVSGVCTSCNSGLFFSYRAEHGNTGRIGAVIAL